MASQVTLHEVKQGRHKIDGSLLARRKMISSIEPYKNGWSSIAVSLASVHFANNRLEQLPSGPMIRFL